MTAGALSVESHEVYFQRDHFAAWPANYGLWIWGDEVLVIFADGKVGSQGPLHARDEDHPFRPKQARSLDGGQTWVVEDFRGAVPGGETLSADEHVVSGLRSGSVLLDDVAFLETLSAPIDFTDPEMIVMAARTGIHADARSWFYFSRNRGRQWNGPYSFNGLSLTGVAARTDIVALSPHHALFMLSCAKLNGLEGRAFCAESRDGGRTFSLKSFIADDENGYSIMPSSARLTDGTIITIIRRGYSEQRPGWLEGFRSNDEGQSWHPLGRIVETTGHGGNPPALSVSPKDRLYLIYGVRDQPYGIRLKTSDDSGVTWSNERIVRDNVILSDLGYARSSLRQDGKIICIYYLNNGHERFIEASIVSDGGLGNLSK
ncbi:sialidase family protein [Rhizobium grahamii]